MEICKEKQHQRFGYDRILDLLFMSKIWNTHRFDSEMKTLLFILNQFALLSLQVTPFIPISNTKSIRLTELIFV